jgi:hypothetical protein
MIDTREARNGCGERHIKWANRPKKGERISQGKLGWMGMMGKWIKVGVHFGIMEKLTTDSLSNACWDGWDKWDV